MLRALWSWQRWIGIMVLLSIKTEHPELKAQGEQRHPSFHQVQHRPGHSLLSPIGAVADSAPLMLLDKALPRDCFP
jgi:hypothetical protein